MSSDRWLVLYRDVSAPDWWRSYEALLGSTSIGILKPGSLLVQNIPVEDRTLIVTCGSDSSGYELADVPKIVLRLSSAKGSGLFRKGELVVENYTSKPDDLSVALYRDVNMRKGLLGYVGVAALCIAIFLAGFLCLLFGLTGGRTAALPVMIPLFLVFSFISLWLFSFFYRSLRCVRTIMPNERLLHEVEL
jgi:hypothetical protein